MSCLLNAKFYFHLYLVLHQVQLPKALLPKVLYCVIQDDPESVQLLPIRIYYSFDLESVYACRVRAEVSMRLNNFVRMAYKKKSIEVNWPYRLKREEKSSHNPFENEYIVHELTVWNLNAINGRIKSNQFVIFLPISSGRMTSNEFPMLRTTISELKKRKWGKNKMRKNENQCSNCGILMRTTSKYKHLTPITRDRAPMKFLSQLLILYGIDDVINDKQANKQNVMAWTWMGVAETWEWNKNAHKCSWSNKAYPKTIQNGKISNRTDALIGRCFSSRVIARDAKVNARLSNVNWNVTWTVSNKIHDQICWSLIIILHLLWSDSFYLCRTKSPPWSILSPMFITNKWNHYRVKIEIIELPR